MRSLCEVRVLPHRTCSKINLSAWGKVRLVGGRWCAGKEWTKRWGYEDEEISGFGMNCFPTMSLTVSRSYLLPICAPHTSNKLSARSSSEPWHFCGYWSLEPATGSYWEQISNCHSCHLHSHPQHNNVHKYLHHRRISKRSKFYGCVPRSAFWPRLNDHLFYLHQNSTIFI